tara:strand:- start:542 stop:874 length:333 start_codon:yes stop_codon:yes gene_type:complete
MKPNLISQNIILSELKNIKKLQDYSDYKIFNITLLLFIILIFFMIFYVFRDKKTKKKRINETIEKLKYISEKSDYNIESLKQGPPMIEYIKNYEDSYDPSRIGYIEEDIY